jgi:hypothetical protein
MFIVELEGIADVERKWARTTAEIHDGAVQAVVKASQDGAEEGKRAATWKDQTGAARRTIHAKTASKAFHGVHADIVAPLHYHRHLDAGTRPHEILPVKAWFLRFRAKDGTRVFARRVWHPGTKGDGFAGKMYLKAERVLRAELEAVMAKVAAKWG